MFIRSKYSLSGNLTWPDFESLLHTTEMEEYFKAIDVDISEAQSIFELLDIDQSGTLTAEEFIAGCMRLNGSAKALDLMVLMDQVKALSFSIAKITSHLEHDLSMCKKPTLIKQSTVTTELKMP